MFVDIYPVREKYYKFMTSTKDGHFGRDPAVSLLNKINKIFSCTMQERRVSV